MENLSGIKAHTLRIWEKRYDIVKPKRTDTNIRYYTDEDLRQLLNVCFLYKKGYKISKIAKMSEDEIRQLISEMSSIDLSDQDIIDTLMIFIYELDAYNLNKILDQSIANKGLEATMQEMIYPLLDRLSMSWLTGSFQSVHESFITQIIKSKVIACTELINSKSSNKATYLIYLPEEENQELSINYMHYLIKKNNGRVINLGNDVALVDLITALEILNVDFLFTIINNDIRHTSLQNYVNTIAENLGKTKFLLTGYQTVAKAVDWPQGVIIFKDLMETVNFIETQ